VGGVDAVGRDELGGSFGGRSTLGHRQEQPKFLASRTGANVMKLFYSALTLQKKLV